MLTTPHISGRSLVMVLSFLLLAFGMAIRVQAQSPSPSPSPTTQRRPLPKPPTGVRGFDRYTGGDSTKRGIAAGATRGVNPRRPVAPFEGAAYEARPFFAWEIEPSSRTYHFILYEGDIDTEPAARVVYQADVIGLELNYPKDAPKLEPGKLYSWRVSTPTATGRDDGPVARIKILGGDDAQEIKKALSTAGLLSPKTAADRLDQARVFANFGIWYDALRIASELAQKPDDKEAQGYYDDLLAKLDAEPGT